MLTFLAFYIPGRLTIFLVGIIITIIYTAVRKAGNTISTGSWFSTLEKVRADKAKGVELADSLDAPQTRQSFPASSVETVVDKLSTLDGIQGFSFDHTQRLTPYSLLIIATFEYREDGEDKIAYHYFVLRYNTATTILEVSSQMHKTDAEEQQKYAFSRLVIDLVRGVPA